MTVLVNALKPTHRARQQRPSTRRGKRSAGIQAVVALLLLVLSSAAWAQATVGWIEEGLIMPERVSVKMKLDTGARTSSIDASEIERFQKDGKEWVRFTSHFEDSDTHRKVTKRFERPVVRRVELRGAGGIDHRVTVNMRICFGTRYLDEEFTLNNRAKMIYPVLLGRQTLRHLGPIDVGKTFTIEPRCR